MFSYLKLLQNLNSIGKHALCFEMSSIVQIFQRQGSLGKKNMWINIKKIFKSRNMDLTELQSK